MKIYLIAVGSRTPKWVVQGFDQYACRLPKHCSLELIEVQPVNRKQGDIDKVRREEAGRILDRIPNGSHVIALAENCKVFTTRVLAEKLSSWIQDGLDIAVLVGGADGLHALCFERADECWSLSDLTFPHALVRVIVAEQFYRAWTILSNHPYHRS